MRTDKILAKGRMPDGNVPTALRSVGRLRPGPDVRTCPVSGTLDCRFRIEADNLAGAVGERADEIDVKI